MTAVPCPLDPIPAASDAKAVPFAAVYVRLTKQEHIGLVMQANGWRSQHRGAVERAQWREARYQRVLRQLKEQAAECEAVLRAELAVAHAKIRDLQQRMFGRKSERRKGGTEQQAQALVSAAPRGHQRGAPGHGRTMQSHLSERSEFVEIDEPQCPNCGLGFSAFPGTEDTEVLEIEVQAYRRVIHRRRYRPICDCGCVPGIVTAPSPPRLIARGKFEMSVWVSVLLVDAIAQLYRLNGLRHRGTCYKAANWVHVGQTTGRDKKSAVHHQIIPIKDIWLYPLHNNFVSVLCQ